MSLKYAPIFLTKIALTSDTLSKMAKKLNECMMMIAYTVIQALHTHTGLPSPSLVYTCPEYYTSTYAHFTRALFRPNSSQNFTLVQRLRP